MSSFLLLAGTLGFAVAAWGLWRDVGFIAQPFYAWVWWSYIFVLDGFVARRRKSSLLTQRASLVPIITVWSVTFWYVFELLNLRLQNWYYVGVYGTSSGIALVPTTLFGIAAFATVFLGLFETYDALRALGLFRNLQTRPRPLAAGVTYRLQAAGVTMAGLALGFPYYLAPLIWGSVSFLVEPWNYRRGARSILRDLEAGQPGTLLTLLTAGLVCGFVWESLNFLAPQKWIYTVRGLEGLKLFEMPLLGFLGFPALALDAFATFAAVAYLFHGNRTWEHPDDVGHELSPRATTSRARLVASLPLHVAFWIVVCVFGQTKSVGSVQLTLDDLETLPPASADTLARHDIDRPRQLMRALKDPNRSAAIREDLALTEAGVDELYEEARLLTFKGIGAHFGQLLRQLGYRRVESLASADPKKLHQELEAARGRKRFPALREGMVRVWVLASR